MPDSRELIAAAEIAAERIRELGQASDELLETVLIAVRAESARNRFPAATILGQLTVDFEPARAAVMRMASDKHWHVRRRAMRCLSRETPREFALEVLRIGLSDLDPGVQMKAESMAGFLGFVVDDGRIR